MSRNLQSSDWKVMINNSGTPFLTSDNPFCSYFRDEYDPLPARFVALSPRLLLFILPTRREETLSQQELDLVEFKGDEIGDVNEEFVTKLNEIIVQSAEHVVLCSANKNWVCNLVKKYKNWKVELNSTAIDNYNFFIKRPINKS